MDRPLVDVGALDEFGERSVRVVSVNGREVGVVRWRGEEVYALHNRCPHMAGPLCLGALSPRLGGSPGRPEVDDAPVIACGWHHWEFDVQTGESLWDPRYRVKTYPAEVRDGRVLVGVR